MEQAYNTTVEVEELAVEMVELVLHLQERILEAGVVPKEVLVGVEEELLVLVVEQVEKGEMVVVLR